MSWFILILIATSLFSLNDITDKFFCEKKFKNIYSLAVVINLIALIFIVILSFFVKFSLSWDWPLFFAIISGPAYFIMWIFWYKALMRVEVSRAFAIFNTAPIFNAFMAVIFLGEVLTPYKCLAFFLIVVGAIICSWENKSSGQFNPIYLLVVLAAAFNAVGNITTKLALQGFSPFAVYAISAYAALPFYLFLLTKKEVFAEVKTSLLNLQTRNLLFFRAGTGFIANLFFYFSLVTGLVSLISAVQGTGPILVFLYAIIISLFWPKFIKEELSKSVLIAKTLAIILIVGGVILINL